jgi:hypothetical protein
MNAPNVICMIHPCRSKYDCIYIKKIKNGVTTKPKIHFFTSLKGKWVNFSTIWFLLVCLLILWNTLNQIDTSRIWMQQKSVCMVQDLHLDKSIFIWEYENQIQHHFCYTYKQLLKNDLKLHLWSLKFFPLPLLLPWMEKISSVCLQS